MRRYETVRDAKLKLLLCEMRSSNAKCEFIWKVLVVVLAMSHYVVQVDVKEVAVKVCQCDREMCAIQLIQMCSRIRMCARIQKQIFKCVST